MSILNEIQSFAKLRDKAGENKFALELENTHSCHGKNGLISKCHKTGPLLTDLQLQIKKL